MNRRALTLELIALLVVASLLLTAVFAIMPKDQILATDLQHLTNPFLDALLRGVSAFGYVVVEAPLIGLAVAIFAWRRRWLEAGFVAVATIGSGALGTILKIVVGRARPVLATGNGTLWQLVDRYSFPSGHAVFYTAFFGALAFLLWKRFNGRARWAGIIICLALIVLVGPSRVFLGAHWPSDVLAGYLVGGVWLSAVIVCYQWRYGW
jgi:membrane-associated phospholipid phosphatase